MLALSGITQREGKKRHIVDHLLFPMLTLLGQQVSLLGHIGAR